MNNDRHAITTTMYNHPQPGFSYIIAGLALLGYTLDILNSTKIFIIVASYLIVYGILCLRYEYELARTHKQNK